MRTSEKPAQTVRSAGSEDQTILQTDGLTKKFGSLVAVDDVTWSVEEGQIHAIIGPNGAGKSTFFNMLSGLLEPTSGSIRFDGEEVAGLTPHKLARKGIVKTSQVTNIFNESTVFENVAYAAQAHSSVFNFYSKAAGSDVDRRAQAVIDRLGLQDVQSIEVSELSHGDQRKVEMGLALATDPEVILLDEPTAGMASDETQQMLELMQMLADDSMTLVITEHDIELVLELSDCITVLHQGSVLAQGDADSITSNEQVQRVYLGE